MLYDDTWQRITDRRSRLLVAADWRNGRRAGTCPTCGEHGAPSHRHYRSGVSGPGAR